MKKRILLAMFLLLLYQTNGFSASQKFALIIGNASYKDVPLRSPVNDATALSSTLEKIGFSVIKKTNITREEMENAVRIFTKQLEPDDVALFYFSGHGMQVDGENYLVPINADIRSEDEVKYKAFDVGMVMSKLETAGSRLNIIILDACRNNPFKGFRSASGGLAQMTAPAGTLIVYATAPGTVAYDGDGKYSPYTTHLLEMMTRPGMEVEKVFKQVRIAVMNDTDGKQVPWESSSLTGDFYFLPSLPPTPTPVLKMADSANATSEISQSQVLRVHKIVLQDNNGNILHSDKQGKFIIPVNVPVKISADILTLASSDMIGITWTCEQGKLLPLIDSPINTYITTKKGGDRIVIIVWNKETGKETRYVVNVEAVNSKK